MKIIRKIILFFTSLTFIGLLFLTAGSWTINHTIANKETVKSWLRESGAYDHFVDEVVRLATAKQNKDAAKPDNGDKKDVSNFNVADLQTAAEKTFTPTFLSTNLEKVLDGTYAWLDGSSPQLNFSLDLTEAKKNFATELGNTALTKAATLPVCTAANAPSNGDFDPMSATCIPNGVNVNAEIQKFVTDFQTSKDILPDPVVTADQLKVDSKSGSDSTQNNSQRIDQAFSKVPGYFQLAKKAAFALTGLSVLWAVLIILLSSTKRYGLKHVAKGLLIVSISLLATSLILRPGTNKLNDAFLKPRAGDASSFSQQIIVPLVQKINDSTKEWGLVFAAIYGFIGLAIVIFLLATKKHKHPGETILTEQSHTEVAAKTPNENIHPESVAAKKSEAPKGPPEVKNKSVQG